MQEVQETWVWSLGGEESLEEGMATHSSILAWRMPWTEEPGGLQSMGLQRVGHDWSDWARTHAGWRMQMDSQVKRYVGWGLGGSQAQLQSWSRSALPFWYLDLPTWNLSEPCAIKMFMEASSFRHEQSLTPFSVLLSQENGGEAENSKLLIMSLWWQAPILEPTQSCLFGTNTLLLTRKLKVFQEPCVRNWGQTPNMRTKVALYSYHLGYHRDFRGVCYGLEAETNIYYIYIYIYIYIIYIYIYIYTHTHITCSIFSQYCKKLTEAIASNWWKMTNRQIQDKY